MIVIVDYGMGNVGSICNMLKKVGMAARISSVPDVIQAAEMLILPGVGAFDNGMRRLHELSLVSVLNEKVLGEKTPVLGICLGMQLMTRGSEEGRLPGLGWIDAETLHFKLPKSSSLKVPHMGWNYLSPVRDHELWKGLDDPRYYFVHSYYVRCRNPNDILATAIHEKEFTAAVRRDNIIGMQFHPEKSHRYGLTLLRNLLGSLQNAPPASASQPAA